MKHFLKFALSVLLLVSISQNIFSQITFEKSFGSYYGGNCARQTYDTGYILLNTYYGDGSAIVGFASLLKTDSLGNFVWQKTIADTGAAIFTWGSKMEITSDSGYIVIGYCMYIFQGSNNHIVVSKTDKDGNVLWNKIYENLVPGYITSGGYDIKETRDKGYILTGVVYDSVNTVDEMIVIKTDSAGNILWQTTDVGIHWAVGLSVAEAEDDNYLIFGYTTLSTQYTSFMYLVKLDSVGNKIWGKTFDWNGGNSYTSGYSVKANSNGEYFLFGTGMYAGNTSGEMLMIKTDTAGNVHWKKSYQNNFDVGYDFDITSDGGLSLVGTTSNNNGDIYFVRTDSAGTQQWYRTFGGMGPDGSGSIRQTSDNGFIIAGGSGSVVGGGEYLIKTNDSGDVALVILPILSNDNYCIRVYPNPVSENLFISNTSLTEATEIKIYNTLGVPQYCGMSSPYKKSVDVHALPSGIYWIELTNGEKIFRNKFVKQ